MMSLPTLQFLPIVREYIWGGRRLAELGKLLGPGEHFAESWEVVDHGMDQSVVVDTRFAGVKLHDLVLQQGRELLGRHHPRPQFPLLFKYLDCQRTLSVQVHPNDEQAARLNPPDLGKTEAWVVLAADPGSVIYAGLKPGVDRDMLARAVEMGKCDEFLHSLEPKVGDCLLIEAGTVHALGAGLLVAEIQQSSNTTYRLFDWNRVDSDGKPRQLHIEKSLETIDFGRGPVDRVKPRPTENPHVERLVECEKFVLDRWRTDEPDELETSNQFHIVTVTDGRATIRADGLERHLKRGDTVLIPASCAEFNVLPQGRAELLDMYLP